MLEVLQGDALAVLRTLPEKRFRCCVTSPPYYGLRDYGMEGQVGRESTIEEYVSKLKLIFRQVRRVLTDDGTCWLNLGDSYCSAGGVQDGRSDNQVGVGAAKRVWREGSGRADGVILDDGDSRRNRNGVTVSGLPAKNLLGIPWRVAFALQEDGWYLRQDIIWHKPNPMPESVEDRCTKSHEYIFLLSKSQSYFYDNEAIKERAVGLSEHDLTGSGYDAPGQSPNGGNRASWKGSEFHTGKTAEHQLLRASKKRGEFNGKTNAMPGREVFRACLPTRNKRSVWTVPSAPYSGAHFATFPPDLITPCIQAGSAVGDVVLDPFGGSGTTGMVALGLGRRATLIELNPAYIQLIRQRCETTIGLPL